MPAMLTTAEAAYALGVTPRTVRRHAKAGTLPSRLDPQGDLRFDPADVAAAKRDRLIVPKALQPGTAEASPEVLEVGPPTPGPVPDFLAPAAPGPDGDLRAWLLTEEAAEQLRLSVRSVRELAALGTIPARRFGGHWRIHRSVLEAPPTR
ncbi:helix-turn-helix domain-containing protein [Streptomyces goshikiensis]|uniref:helix-turn-helix domain-containing protein n=1 Tax=Streptomyces TaxID=1883 RepID=UPI0036572A68